MFIRDDKLSALSKANIEEQKSKPQGEPNKNECHGSSTEGTLSFDSGQLKPSSFFENESLDVSHMNKLKDFFDEPPLPPLKTDTLSQA